jgi:hypothetical protein
VSDAVIAIYNWFRYYKEYPSMETPPKNLFDELINRILLRKQPRLDKLLEIAILLLQSSPELFSDNHLESIYIALEYLFNDTYLIEEMSIDIFEKDEDLTWDIPLKKIPKYRKLSAELAFTLYNYLVNEDQEIPAVLEEWKTKSEHDKWPEVKRVWEKFFDI